MTLDEAFILTCHTTFISDKTFIVEEQGFSQDFLDRCALILKRDVYLEEFLIDKGIEVVTELREASYDAWMEIVNSEKQ